MGGAGKRSGVLHRGKINGVKFNNKGRRIFQVYKEGYTNKKGSLVLKDSMELGAQKSGSMSVSMCYGDQKEEFNIGRNNARQ